MKHYSRVHETDSHYVLRDSRDGKMFHVAKKGIDKDTHQTIQNLASYDQRPLSQQPQKRTNPSANPAPIDPRLQQNQPQAFADGGEVVPPAVPAASTPQAQAAPSPMADKSKSPSTSTGGDTASPTKTSTETGGSSPGGASTGGVGSGIGGAGTGGAATGGASTGGAGTVNVTISGSSGTSSSGGSGGSGREAPITINISNVGGRTDAGEVASGDGPGSPGTGGKGDGSGGGGGGAAPSEPSDMSSPGKKKVSPLDNSNQESDMQHFDEGTQNVQPSPSPSPSNSQDTFHIGSQTGVSPQDASDSVRKAKPFGFGHYEGGQIQGYDDGGPVLDPNLVAGFVKGFKGHADGGEIQNYDEGTQSVEPSHTRGMGDDSTAPQKDPSQSYDFQDPSVVTPERDGPPATSPGVYSDVVNPNDNFYMQPANPNPSNVPIIGKSPQEQNSAPVAKSDADNMNMQTAPKESTLQQDLNANNDAYNALIKKQQLSDAKYSELIANGKLNPDRFYDNQGLGQKLSMGIGLLLGGISSGITGKSNPALDMLNNAINRDIEAQKTNSSTDMNLWKMNHESLKDAQAATLQTRNQILEHAKIKMDELMGNAPGAMAQQKAAALKTQIEAEQMQNQFAIGRSQLMQRLFHEQNTAGNGSPTGALSQRDPGSLVPLIVPSDQQKAAFGEIKDRQTIAANGPKIMAAFDQANKDLSLMSADINPPSVDQLHQLIMPLFDSLDGTVRQAAMDETFKNITPRRTDITQNRVDTRRQGLQDWLTSKKAAPISRSFGIDLDKYQSTAPQIGGQTFKKNGVLYQKLPDGSSKRVR